MSLYRKYIKPEWHDNIKNYKYSTSNLSFFYNNIMSPFCNVLIEKFPTWLAPNVITLGAFSLIFLMTYIVHIYAGNDGKGELPSYILVIAGILYYTYHILDNLDGKQARRTGSSSPLGLLVDHGCDSITSFMMTNVMTSATKLSESSFNYFLVFSVASIPFYLAVWEQFQTGVLELGCFNGVDEGSLIFLILLIFTAVVGQNFWLQKLNIAGISVQYNSIMLAFSLFGCIFYSIVSIRNVVKYHNKRNFENNIKNENANIENPSNTIIYTGNPILNMYQIFYSLVPFILFKISLLVTFLVADNALIVNTCPKVVIMLYGFMFGKLLLHLMMAHVSKSEFEQWRMSIITCCIAIPLVSIFSNIRTDLIVELNTVIVIYFVKNFLLWLNFSIKISYELCDLLNIQMFSIKDSLKDKENYLKVDSNESK